MTSHPATQNAHKPWRDSICRVTGRQPKTFVNHKENMKKSLVSLVVGLAVAVSLAITPESRAQAQIASSNAIGTVSLNVSNGVALSPVPSGWVCVQKTGRVTTGTAVAITGNSGASNSTSSAVLLQAADGWVTESTAPIIDGSTTYGLSTGGTAVVSYWLKLRH